MLIQHHNLSANSEHHYSREEQQVERLRVAEVSRDAAGNRRVDTLVEIEGRTLEQSDTYSRWQSRLGSDTSGPASTAQATHDPDMKQLDSSALQPRDRLKLELISRLHKMITGQELRIKLFDPSVLEAKQPASDLPQTMTGTPSAPDFRPQQPAIGMEFERVSRINEEESSLYQVQGEVRTKDGKTINIDLSLQMARSVTQQESSTLRLGARLSDPLVINFDGKAAELSQTRFSFDLDLDGQKDEIPTLAGNRAFLALDRNNDGEINDGRELFGARTGDGFAELARYDDDGNGFIDEGDEIFSRLRLWSPGAEGESSLVSLASKGVGAIWLDSADTEFSLTPNLTENRLGVIRSTSFFLSESGGSGTVQHVDLSI